MDKIITLNRLNDFLTNLKDKFVDKTDANSTYATKEELNSAKTTADDTYVNKTDASNTYATKTELTTAENNASNTYLSKTDASDTYVNKTDASKTYVTKEQMDAQSILKRWPDGPEAHNAMWGGRDITAAFNNGTTSCLIVMVNENGGSYMSGEAQCIAIGNWK